MQDILAFHCLGWAQVTDSVVTISTWSIQCLVKNPQDIFKSLLLSLTVSGALKHII